MSAGLVSQHQQSLFASPVNGDAGDATVVLGNDNATVSTYDAHDADGTIHVQSSTAAMFNATPAGVLGRKWMTNDTGAVYLYYDTGSAWVEVNYQRTASTGAVVIVSTSTPQLTVEYDGSHTSTFSVSSGGALTINATSTVTITPATTITGALTQTGLATFNGGATITSGQTLTVSGATITGLTAASVGAGTFPAGAYVFASGGVTVTSGGLTVSAGTTAVQALTATSADVVKTQNASTTLRVSNPDNTNISTQAQVVVSVNSVDIGAMKTVAANLTGASRRALYLTTLGVYDLAFGINSSPTPSMTIDGSTQAVSCVAGISATTGTFSTSAKTASGSQSCLTGVSTTLFTVPGSGTYLVFVYDNAGGNISGSLQVSWDGTNALLASALAASALTFAVPTTVVQCTQSSGSTKTMNWSYIRIN